MMKELKDFSTDFREGWDSFYSRGVSAWGGGDVEWITEDILGVLESNGIKKNLKKGGDSSKQPERATLEECCAVKEKEKELDKNIESSVLRILDIGCGDGRSYSLLLDNLTYAGIDVKKISTVLSDYSMSGLLIAEKHLRNRNTAFVQANSYELPFKNNIFDIVIASHIIDHLPFREAVLFLKECRRAMNPGGRIYLRTFHALDARSSYFRDCEKGEGLVGNEENRVPENINAKLLLEQKYFGEDEYFRISGKAVEGKNTSISSVEKNLEEGRTLKKRQGNKVIGEQSCNNSILTVYRGPRVLNKLLDQSGMHVRKIILKIIPMPAPLELPEYDFEVLENIEKKDTKKATDSGKHYYEEITDTKNIACLLGGDFAKRELFIFESKNPVSLLARYSCSDRTTPLLYYPFYRSKGRLHRVRVVWNLILEAGH
ncbi:MAG: methyltransferase domain-containing protein [Thermoplasmata archaeon]